MASSRSRVRMLALAVTGPALLLTACASDTSGSPSGGPAIVVTTPILGSVVSSIVDCAGSGSVEVLMPNGSDPHDFAASSAQLADLVSADLVIANGLGLEAGMTAALAGARADGARIWEAGPNVDPIPFEGADDHSADDHSADDHGGALDPHIWFDMGRMATAATLIGQQLDMVAGTSTSKGSAGSGAVRSGDGGTFAACGAQVADQISAAERTVRATLESVPADRRVLVTDHEALGYLAAAYGYRIAGAVIPSQSTLAEPSSAELAALAEVIRQEQVPAIFANVSSPAQLAQAVAQEAGTQVSVVPLYVESLGEPGSPAQDYPGMMLEDATRIAGGLGAPSDG
ncbi:MAG: metal ABC transporter substrate-binding protein [Actinomycetales bacterium]|nr:metal ABC transporter substrate-binding protein [Actinomycetales bacterium]